MLRVQDFVLFTFAEKQINSLINKLYHLFIRIKFECSFVFQIH